LNRGALLSGVSAKHLLLQGRYYLTQPILILDEADSLNGEQTTVIENKSVALIEGVKEKRLYTYYTQGFYA